MKQWYVALMSPNKGKSRSVASLFICLVTAFGFAFMNCWIPFWVCRHDTVVMRSSRRWSQLEEFRSFHTYIRHPHLSFYCSFCSVTSWSILWSQSSMSLDFVLKNKKTNWPPSTPSSQFSPSQHSTFTLWDQACFEIIPEMEAHLWCAGK